jgi:SAM-dependent methyltransferase
MIIAADALAYLKTMPPLSAQTCITSPPYYRLRDYGADGQIGLEMSVLGYINRLSEVFREVYRVLADDGVLWIFMKYDHAKKCWRIDVPFRDDRGRASHFKAVIRGEKRTAQAEAMKKWLELAEKAKSPICSLRFKDTVDKYMDAFPGGRRLADRKRGGLVGDADDCRLRPR